MTSNHTDLFGEVAVTINDITLWVENVARLPRNSPRFHYYVEHWNVIEKIRRAKISGTFDNLTSANDESYPDLSIIQVDQIFSLQKTQSRARLEPNSAPNSRKRDPKSK